MATSGTGAWRCPRAWLEDGWHEDVVLRCQDGILVGVDVGGAHEALPRLPGPVVPGMSNAHSHAFQWAMGGLAEHARGPDDSFWTWRQTMYGFVGALEPEDVEAVAAQLYVSMLEAGYTGVAEFHYLHHDRRGVPYADQAELAWRMVAAAETAGIGLTLLPTLYAHSDVGGRDPLPEQARFVHTPETLCRVLDKVRAAAPAVRVGAAAHSLRAVTPDELRALLAGVDAIDATAPLHIHVSEQPAEVAACQAVLGSSPVAWLADEVGLSPRWGLVHATHTSDAELRAMASAGAVAVLCPTTEANLGDGLFDVPHFAGLGGRMAVGSDSHVCVDPAEELRWLEGGQRLVAQRRNVVRLSDALPQHVGAGLWQATARHGAAALGRDAGVLAPGMRADWVVLDTDHPRAWGRQGDHLVDTWVMAGGRELVREVWVAGERVVAEGVHVRHRQVAASCRAAMKRLFARL